MNNRNNLCANCKLRARYDKNSKSLLGRFWRWHIGFCPGWKGYMKQLNEEECEVYRKKYNLTLKTLLIVITLNCVAPSALPAQSRFVERSTDVLCLVPSATGLVKAIVEHDRKGILELGLSSVTGIALNYGLNACIKKDRPEIPLNAGWSDHHAFPSTHTMATFNGASFLMRRYGWKWGVPAYAVSTYVAWGRVHVGKHDWWDVLGGAAIGAGSAFIFTHPFVRNVDLTIAPVSFGDDGAGVFVAMQF